MQRNFLRTLNRCTTQSRALSAFRGTSTQFHAEPHHRVSIVTEIKNEPGSLHELLKYFWKYDVDMTHIESWPCLKNPHSFHVNIDFEGKIGDQKVDKLMSEVRKRCRNMFVLDEKEVPWFPKHISELDYIADRILDAGSDLKADHPGFSDATYRARRNELAEIARKHRQGDPIPYVQYTPEEIETWGVVWDRLTAVHKKYACDEFLEIFPLMEKHCGYNRNNIPQAQDISRFLQQRTGFTIRPVSGLLSSRDFLNGLAFRVFFSTQYLRHSSMPLYTPEPDLVHEFMGHAPMFADPDFADFSQEIGLASLGASDEEVAKLATCYWFSVEFGLVHGAFAKSGEYKAFGAGLLSSFGELEYSCSSTRPAGGSMEISKVLPWDPSVAANTKYPITCYQPTYFVAESLHDLKVRMRKYVENMPKPFHARYNPLTSSVWVDRAVKSSVDPATIAPKDHAYGK